MLLPVRCFTCGKVLSGYGRFRNLQKTTTISTEDALTQCGFRRYCCRRMIISHVDRITEHLLLQELRQPIPNITVRAEKENEQPSTVLYAV
jgi:DNA-directed RNA polymerase subunit N (RpoN/RPB10)